MAGVIFRDETATGRAVDEFHVELIRLRVREEVARFNARPSHRSEVELNRCRMREAWRIDWERQADIAERAFLSNGFFLLAGDRQVADLDEVVDLTTDPELVFIKLVQLVGG
jgi:hypothetical protein